MIRNRGDYWQVRVYRGRDPLTGRPRHVYGRASSEREAKRVQARLTTEVADGRHKGTDAKTLAELLERWLPWHAEVEELSPGTIANYRRHIDKKITPALGAIPVRHLDAEVLDEFYSELRRRGRAIRVRVGTDPKTGKKKWRSERGPLSASSIREVHAILSGALQQAVKWRWIPYNPARLASPPSVKKAKIVPPDVAQVHQLLEGSLAEELRLGLFLRMAVILGARRGELCALRWDHIDFEHDEIVIERGIVYVPGEPLIDKETKSENQRRIAADTRTMKLLRDHKAACEKVAVELGTALAPDAFVFSYTPDGSVPMHPPAVTHRFARFARKHDVTCRLHDLRHFMVTKALAGGIALPTVAGRAGHSDGGRVTLTTYAHWQRAQDRTAAELLAALCDRHE
jgi:integrase